jgi:hypothetical protein
MELAIIVSFDCHLRSSQATPVKTPGIAGFPDHLYLDLGGFCRFSICFLVQRGLFRTYAVCKFPYRRGVDRRGLFGAWFRVIRRDIKTFATLKLRFHHHQTIVMVPRTHEITFPVLAFARRCIKELVHKLTAWVR